MSDRRRGREARMAARAAQVAESVPFITRALTPFEVLSEEGLSLIEENAETILEQVGIEFRGMPEALGLWREAGADVVGERVHFPRGLCRRLVQASCRFRGATPTTALQAVRGYGRSLGRVLVVNVGYNEEPQGYGDGIDRVMRSALGQGARGVVWVTLRETRGIYHATNVAIRAAARRWPQLVVADWNAYSSGRLWFGDDGLHLTNAGASGLAAFLRPFVLKAAGLGSS